MLALSLAVMFTAPKAVLLVAVGIAAGIANAIAGGGTLLTFPTLLVLGVPAVSANITSAVGIVPSYLGGIHGFRSELETQFPRVRRLLPAALVGGLTGAILLLTTPEESFRMIAPWLVGLATLLFTVQPLVVRTLSSLHDEHPTRRLLIQVGTFAAAVYGGYFGAGMGIMLLAVLSIGFADSLVRLNGLRAVLSIIICTLSATIFVIHGRVVWPAALCIALGTLLGGAVGARIARFLPSFWLRLIVVAFGTVTTIGLVL